jgi:hypothetical protein
MSQLAADQQITLQAFQAAVDSYNQRGLVLPERIAAIANALESHIDHLDTLSEIDSTFQLLYDTARSALQNQSSQRAKFLDTSTLNPTNGSLKNGSQINGIHNSHSTPSEHSPQTTQEKPPNTSIKRFVLPINATPQEQQYFTNYIAQLKQLNPQWVIAPDLPQADETEAYVMIFNDENYHVNHAAYAASQMLQRFFTKF